MLEKEFYMIKEIHKFYPAFYNMLVITTLLSNQSSENYDNDCKNIIDFIGQSYGMSESLINYCKKVILDELVAISTDEDISAFINTHDSDGKLEDIDSLLSMKCDAIGVIESLKDIRNLNISPSWFDYSHYKPYYPDVRFRQLSIAATTGHPIANKAVAILSILGIGCERSSEHTTSGVYRLKQCMIWGDIPSIYFLKRVYEDANKVDDVKVFNDLIKLIPYINEGRTIVPSFDNNEICDEAKRLYSYITSIRQDVVVNEQRHLIDYSFAEVILLNNLDHYSKLKYINNYREQKWKEVTNSSFDPSKKIGFKVGD